MISDAEVLGRLALALALCAAVGLERESRDQAAGLRTHMIVGVGAALFTLVSAYGFGDFLGKTGTRIDPTRISAQIVSGIGFLGAGAILRQGLNVRGLTTAATLWVVAAIGMAAGAGYYFGAVATTALVLPALVLFRRLRGPLVSRLRTDFVLMDLEMRANSDMSDVLKMLRDAGVRLQALATEIHEDGESAQLELRIPPDLQFQPLLRRIGDLEDVRRVRIAGRSWPEGSPVEEG
jgi:putative Mg2+ transporter-C (MgtC) family protein